MKEKSIKKLKKQSKSDKNQSSAVEELKNKITELENSMRRTQADFENYQKRTEAQKYEIIQISRADFMTKITPVLDNFSRAFSSEEGRSTKDDNWTSGVKQIEKQLEDILISEGLKRIDASGKFNPIFHEAISFEENSEVPADNIIAEIESGWEFNGKVIKPAKVRVSKGK